MNASFTGLTADICNQAVCLAGPSIDKLLAERGNRQAGDLIIIDPTIPYEPKYKAPTDANFDELVLWSYQWGNPSEWEFPFTEIAKSKAYISWKTGQPAHRVQMDYPYLYQKGWTKFGGSYVDAGGLVVAFSGVQWFFDRAISEIVAAFIRALCMQQMHEKEVGVLANGQITFLGEEDPDPEN